MKRYIAKYIVAAGAWLAVLYPLWVTGRNISFAGGSALFLQIFPLFGILAFTLLWLHSISGVFEPWLRRHFDFDRFVHVTATLILLSIILHPLLLFAGLRFHIGVLFQGKVDDIWLGIIGLALLLTYDVGKALKRHAFFVRHWNSILLISTIGFLLIFFHSLGLGSDLQLNPLRDLWMFYGVTTILATIYTYGIKRFFRLP